MTGKYGVKNKITKMLTPEAAIVFILLAGLCVRLIYAFSTPWGFYQHDIGGEVGHKAVIEFIATNLKLCDTTNMWQFNHPQLHYIIYALPYRVFISLTNNIDFTMEILEIICVFASLISVVLVKKILKLLNFSKWQVVFGTAFFTFFPSNILMSRYLNNDSTLIIFTLFAVLFALKWYKSKSIKDLVFTAVFTACSMCTKSSGILLLPILGLLFLCSFLFNKKDITSIKGFFVQIGIFFLVFLPLPAFIFGRMYVLFRQPLGYIATPGGLPETGNVFLNFFMPLDIFKDPFAIDPASPDIVTGLHYPEYILKTALFGEFGYDESLILPARIILAFALIFVVMCIVFCTVKLIRGISDKPLAIFVAAGIFLPVVFHISVCIKLPYACTYNYRYLAPFMIFTVITVTKMFKDLCGKGIPKITAWVCLTGFSVASSVFYVVK